MSQPTRLWSCFCQTMRACVTNLACAPFFLIAMAFYAFYYCWPYMNQLPLHIDSVIVDQDHSQLSRALTRAIMASPNYNILGVYAERPAAVRLMRESRISTIIGIPPNFEKNILNGIPTALDLLTNGAFIVKAHSSLTGGSGPLAQTAHAAIMAELLERGVPGSKLLAAQNGSPPVVTVAMYNTIAGYLSFAVSIVFVIIFQTVMVCGFAMLLNDWFSHKKYPEPLEKALRSPAYLLAMQAPVFCFCVFWSFFIEGWAFYWQGMNSFQSVPGTIMASIFYAWSVSSLGLMVGMAFKTSKFAIPAVVMSSLPCVFISGNLFPWQDIPVYMRAFAWILPSTPGVDAMLRASQTGATPLEIFPYLMHMLFLGILYFTIAWLIARQWGKIRILATS